jgi:hypothetical protein
LPADEGPEPPFESLGAIFESVRRSGWAELDGYAVCGMRDACSAAQPATKAKESDTSVNRSGIGPARRFTGVAMKDECID